MAGSKRSRRLEQDQIEQVITRGIASLKSASRNGQWCGFPTMAGESETWVTGFVLAHLVAINPRSTVVTKARRFLVKERSSIGGWGYGGDVPPDGDSTAWCLAALAGTRTLTKEARANAHEFLVAHVDGDGIQTYLPDSGIRDYIRAGPDQSIAGWTSPHPDVTAAALLSGAFRRGGAQAQRTLSWLASMQDRAGIIPAYWWRPPYYTAALTLRAFARYQLRPPERTLEGIAWLVERKQLDHGGYGLGANLDLDPLSTALALECAVYLGHRCSNAVRRAAAAGLVRTQRTDGGWRGDYVMRIPAPQITDPKQVTSWGYGTGGGNSFVPDSQGIFATTLGCHSLRLHSQIEAGQSLEISDEWPIVELAEQEDTNVVVVTNTSAHTNEPCNAPLVN